MEPGQRAYEAFCKAAKFDHIPWKTRMPATKAMWAEIEAACLPAAPEDVAGLVERLNSRAEWALLGVPGSWSYEDGIAMRDAASALQAQAAEIAQLREWIAVCNLERKERDAAEAKLREAVEVIRRWHMADLTGHDGSLSRARQVSEAFLASMEKTDG